MAGPIQEWGVAALGASATIFAGWIVIRASRRDRDQDRMAALEGAIRDIKSWILGKFNVKL